MILWFHGTFAQSLDLGYDPLNGLNDSLSYYATSSFFMTILLILKRWDSQRSHGSECNQVQVVGGLAALESKSVPPWQGLIGSPDFNPNHHSRPQDPQKEIYVALTHACSSPLIIDNGSRNLQKTLLLYWIHNANWHLSEEQQKRRQPGEDTAWSSFPKTHIWICTPVSFGSNLRFNHLKDVSQASRTTPKHRFLIEKNGIKATIFLITPRFLKVVFFCGH